MFKALMSIFSKKQSEVAECPVMAKEEVKETPKPAAKPAPKAEAKAATTKKVTKTKK